MRLRKLEGRYADFALHGASQMAFTDAQFVRELRDAPAVECAASDAVCGDVRESRNRVDDRSPRCKLGATAKTWSEPSAFCGGGRVEESTVVRVRDARRAHRAAIHARRRDADEKQPVEPRISRA